MERYKDKNSAYSAEEVLLAKLVTYEAILVTGVAMFNREHSQMTEHSGKSEEFIENASKHDEWVDSS